MTQRVRTIKNAGQRRRSTSKKIVIDHTCWGKNKPMEQFWRELSSYLSVIIIYKGSKPYESFRITPSEQIYTQLKPFDDDPQVVAILTAHPGINHAYETLVYPKAKDKTVDYVITHHANIFKRMSQHMHSRVNAPLKKIRVPHWSHEMKIKWNEIPTKLIWILKW